MARHRYRKTNNNNQRQSNGNEQHITLNERQNNIINNNDNNGNKGDGRVTSNASNKCVNMGSIANAAQQVANVMHNNITTTENECHGMQASVQSNILQQTKSLTPQITRNGHNGVHVTQQVEHSNENSIQTESNTNNIKSSCTCGSNQCTAPTEIAKIKQEANAHRQSAQNGDKGNLRQAPSSLVVVAQRTQQTAQQQSQIVCANGQKEPMTITSDNFLVQTNATNNKNINKDENIKRISNSEMKVNADAKVTSLSPVAATTSSDVNTVITTMKTTNNDQTTSSIIEKQSNVQEQKVVSSISGAPSSQSLTSLSTPNAMKSVSTTADSSTSTNTNTNTNTANVVSSTSTINTQVLQPTSSIRQSLQLHCQGSSALINNNNESSPKQSTIDVNKCVQANKSNTVQTTLLSYSTSNKTEDSGVEMKRCTLIDVKAVMAMKPRKSALRVNSPSSSYNGVIDNADDNNSNGSDNGNSFSKNKNCCSNENKNESESVICNSTSHVSQMHSHSVNNNISSTSNSIGTTSYHNNSNNDKSKDSSARSRRRIRFCEPIVTSQDDGLYSHYYTSSTNAKQHSCQSQQSHQSKANAKVAKCVVNSTNYQHTHEGHDQIGISNYYNSSSMNSSNQNEHQVKQKKTCSEVAQSYSVSSSNVLIYEQMQEMHISNEKHKPCKVNGTNGIVNGVCTSDNKSKNCDNKNNITNNNNIPSCRKQNGETDSNKSSSKNRTNHGNMSANVDICHDNSTSTNNAAHSITTLAQNKLSADSFAFLRRRTIAHVQSMWGQLRLRVIVLVLCIIALIMRPVLRRWWHVIMKRITNMMQRKSLKVN